jgi:hypothetical protein
VEFFLWEIGRNLSIPSQRKQTKKNCHSFNNHQQNKTYYNTQHKWNFALFTGGCVKLNKTVLKYCMYPVDLAPCVAMKSHGESGGLVPLIRNFDSKCSWVVSFTLRLLYLWGRAPPFPRYLFIGRLCEPQSLSGSLDGYTLLPGNRTTIPRSSDP